MSGFTQEQLVSALVEALKSSPVREQLTTMIIESHKMNNPVIINQISESSSEKTANKLANSFGEMQTKINILEGQLTTLTAKKPAAKKNEAKETTAQPGSGAASATAPASPASTPAAPIKTPVAVEAPKSFGNRLLYVKFLARSDADTYKQLVPENVITSARATDAYAKLLASITAKTPLETASSEAKTSLVNTEAQEAFNILKGPSYKAAYEALSASMAAYNARLATPSKVEEVEKLD